jgi:glycosyltransferase involved in cell wall biosynthesis
MLFTAAKYIILRMVIVDSYLSTVDLELQRSLEDAGVDTWIISSSSTHPQYRNTSLIFDTAHHKQLALRSIDSPIVSLSLFFPFPIFRKLRSALEKIDPDFVQTTEHFSSPSFWCNFRKHDWKTILIERAAPKTGIISKLRIYDMFARQFVLPNVDAFAALNSYAADNLKYLGCKADIAIIPNPVDTEYFRILTPWEDRKNIIMYVGRLIKEKLLHILINCMPIVRQKIPDAELWFIGDGKDADFYRDLGKGRDYIKFLGSKARRDLLLLYNRAKVLVILYKNKAAGIGMAAEEAIACGVPIVSSENIAFDETENPYYCICKHTPESLADGIIGNISAGEHYSKNARYIAEKTYSHKAVGDSYRKMINKL